MAKKPGDGEDVRLEPEQKDSSCHKTKRTHFDSWSGEKVCIFSYVVMFICLISVGADDVAGNTT